MSPAADGRAPERMAAEWSIALREDPADAALLMRFEAWLHADPRHAEAWSQIQDTIQVIKAAPPQHRSHAVSSGGGARRRVRGRLREKTFIHAGSAWKSAVVTAAAACLLLAVAPTVSLHLKADHISRVGEVSTIRLPDGSRVELGPDSAIAVDYGPGARGVRLLAGQAMFEVNRDPGRPFRVVSGDVTTTVLGTGFEVRRIGSGVNVAVQHGRVRVEDGAASRELAPGDWVRTRPNASMSAGVMSPELVGDWRTGRVAIRNQSIVEAVEEIRPWYRGKIIIADPTLREKQVSGAYDFHDPARSLSLIVAPYGGAGCAGDALADDRDAGLNRLAAGRGGNLFS